MAGMTYVPEIIQPTEKRERSFVRAEFTDTLRGQVWRLLAERYGNLPQYRTDWYFDLEWTAEGARLHKKVRSYFHRKLGIAVDEDVQKLIADLSAKDRGFAVVYDVTDRFDWEPGDFSDRGSCYWGSYRKARLSVIPRLGGVALRSFDVGGKGNGRCWMVPIPPTKTPGGVAGFATFNYYGAMADYERANLIALDVLTVQFGGEWRANKMSDLSVFGCYINDQPLRFYAREVAEDLTVEIHERDIARSLHVPAWGEPFQTSVPMGVYA